MRKKLGEILVASGVVTQTDLDVALGDQTAGEPSRVGDLLVALGKITPVQLARALSQQHAIPFIQLPPVPGDVLKTIPIEFQQQHRLVPFRVTGEAISVAVADPSNIDAIEELRSQLNKKVNRYVAASDEIDAIHAGALGVASLDMPSIAPAVAPVSRGPSAKELFGSLELEPSASASSLGDDLFSGIDLPPPDVGDLPPPPAVAPVAKVSRRAQEDEPEFFEASPAPRSVPVAAPAALPAESFELDGVPIEQAADGLTSSPSGTFDLTSAVEEISPEPVSEPSGSFEVAVSDSGNFGAAPAAEPFDYPFTDSGNFVSSEGPAPAVAAPAFEFPPPPGGALESSGTFDLTEPVEPSGNFAFPPPPPAAASLESGADFAFPPPPPGASEATGDFVFPPPPAAPVAGQAESSGSFEVSLSEASGDFAAPPQAVDDFFAPAPPAPGVAPRAPAPFSSAAEEPISVDELPMEPEPAEPLFEVPAGEPLFVEPAPAIESPSPNVVVAAGPDTTAPIDFPPPPPAPVEPYPELEPAAPVPVVEAPAPASMPSWLGADASAAAAPVAGFVLTPGEWTGRLDDVPPSRLIVGAVKALVTKGLVTEAEILEALGKKG
ncbi:MAG: hypothetical protein MUC96_32020 [Myxococcaceae bacterium]|jgi:hypothetical protein|nr:hypothetical protein [Myxococcaceae bacterium]